MARRTVEISRDKAHLSVRDGQLLIIRDGEASSDHAGGGRSPDRPDLATTRSMRSRIPCEDLGLVLVDHPETTYTHAALTTLAQAGAALVVCGRDHLPTAVLLPLSSHTEQVWRVSDQIDCGKVIQKQLWTAIVRAKIIAQASNLAPDSPAHRRLMALARRVRSGDPENLEAQAARVYWSALFPSRGDWTFKRKPRDRTPPNNLLDYGYAVLRAAVARALVGAGLFPAIGIHHSNRSNAFCLADDLVEPLRPMIDRRARHLFNQGHSGLDQPTKAELLLILTAIVGLGQDATIGPLDAALPRYAASLARSLASGRVELLIPVEPPGPEAQTCLT